jgi:hypothetical protein
MDDDLDTPHILDPVLDRGAIDISAEIGTHMSFAQFAQRVHHHFQHGEWRYKALAHDSFDLRVRSRKYPLFGTFHGQVHLYEKVPFSNERPYRTYAIEGLLEYRMSVLWFLSVLSFFFLITYITHPGLFVGAAVIAFGGGMTIYMTHHLGRGERDEVEEQVHDSLFRLRSTLQNLR